MQSLVSEEITFRLVSRLILHIVISREKETARATGRVAHSLSNLRTDAVNHSFDKGTRCKVLTCATLFVLSVLLQNAFIDSTLHVCIHHQPLLFVNHADDLFQVNRLVNLILRFSVDCTNKVVLFAEYFQCFFILLQQIQSVELNKIIPLIASRYRRIFSKHFNILCIHLQEKQISELRDIISKANTLSSKRSGEVPYFFSERLLG